MSFRKNGAESLCRGPGAASQGTRPRCQVPSPCGTAALPGCPVPSESREGSNCAERMMLVSLLPGGCHCSPVGATASWVVSPLSGGCHHCLVSATTPWLVSLLPGGLHHPVVGCCRGAGVPAWCPSTDCPTGTQISAELENLGEIWEEFKEF